VCALIQQYTDPADLGRLGDPGVTVLRLNMVCDALQLRH
jgi:K+-transporting ATPase c subunit